MKYLLAAILVYVSSSFGDLDRIATINKLKKEAKAAYNKGDYKTAIEDYQYLLDSMEVKDDNVRLNLANAFYQSKDTTNALNNYQSLTSSENNNVQSVAQQQLGIMANRSKKFKEALQHFKHALKADPTNEEARYNYELLKKVLKEQDQNKEDKKNQQDKKDKEQQDGKDKKDQNKENQEKDQENKDQKKQDEKKDGEGEEKEQKDQDQKKDKGEEKEGGKKDKKEQQEQQEGKESDEKNKKKDQMNAISDKLKEMKISEEKAQMILEALKNKEIQYYQQNKRKATKRTDSDKPDW